MVSGNGPAGCLVNRAGLLPQLEDASNRGADGETQLSSFLHQFINNKSMLIMKRILKVFLF